MRSWSSLAISAGVMRDASGAKAPSIFLWPMKPEAKASGYLIVLATAVAAESCVKRRRVSIGDLGGSVKQILCGNDNKKSKSGLVVMLSLCYPTHAPSA